MHIPEIYEETHPGVIERKTYFPSSEFYQDYNDIEEYRRIIDVDLPHYKRMVKDNPFPEIVGKYNKILSIGGGIPKIETYYLKANEVDVIEMKKEVYQQLVAYYKDEYKVEPTIRYVDKPGEYDCVAFVHFLEHITWNTVCEIIENQTTDIFIYMPNIEAAENDNWFHFANFVVDHNTFFTMDAMKRLGVSLGYEVESKGYKDDMFIWMKK